MVMGESIYLFFVVEDGEEVVVGVVDEFVMEDDGVDYFDIELEEDEEEMDYEFMLEEIWVLEEEEELGVYYLDGNFDFVMGYFFDDLKKVCWVLVLDDVGEKVEWEVCEVLLFVMGLDIWEVMLDEFEGVCECVVWLMDNYNV